MTHTQKRPVARGSKDARFPGLTSVVIRLDDETFAEVRALAIKNGTSFGEQVRTLVEWGLEAGK